MTLDVLHRVLQAAMGWHDVHLHRFVEDRDEEPGVLLTDGDLVEGDEGVPEREVRIDQVLRESEDSPLYHYAFGDGWEHRLSVEALLPAPPETPRCRDGG